MFWSRNLVSQRLSSSKQNYRSYQQLARRT